MNNIFDKMKKIVNKEVKFYQENYFEIDKKMIEINGEGKKFFWGLNSFGTNLVTQTTMEEIIDYYFNRKDVGEEWKKENIVGWYASIVDNIMRNNDHFYFYDGKELKEISKFELMNEIYMVYSRLYNKKVDYKDRLNLNCV